jgi:sugar lactone lactonase YvrE
MRSSIMLPAITSSLLILAAMAPAQIIETVDGVRIVHNEKTGAWASRPKVELQLLRTIGDVDTEDEHLAFNAPMDIALDAAGNIYILDSGNCRIQKFSPEGKFLMSIGRTGQGPGEFANPTSIDVDSKGFVYVVDSNQNRLVVFKPDGGHFKSYPTSGLGLGRIRFMKSGLIATRVEGGGVFIKGPGSKPGLPELPTKLIKLLDLELNPKAVFGEAIDYKEPITNQMANGSQIEVGKDDQIYLAFFYQNRIEKYAPDGKLLWKADRPLNFSTEMVEKGRMESSGNSMSYWAPKMNRCAIGVAADSKNRVWVLTMTRQLKDEEKIGVTMMSNASGTTRKITGNTDLRTTDAYKLEVFDPDGLLLGSIPLGNFADGIRIAGDSLFLLDQMRGVKYYQYRILER